MLPPESIWTLAPDVMLPAVNVVPAEARKLPVVTGPPKMTDPPVGNGSSASTIAESNSPSPAPSLEPPPVIYIDPSAI